MKQDSIAAAFAAGAILLWAGNVQAQAPAPATVRPDLTGTWSAAAPGAPPAVIAPKAANASVCVIQCPPAGGAAAAAPAAEPAARPVPDAPKYKPEFQAKVAELTKLQTKLDPGPRCQLPGVPRIGPPAKIFQNATEVAFLYTPLAGSFFRIIPIDGRPMRKIISPTSFGESVGKWEGDTLVVETAGLSDDTWMAGNGAFHTNDLRVVERFKRSGDTLEYSFTAYDPAVLAEPWQSRPRTLRLTQDPLEEVPRCEDRSMDKVLIPH